VTVLACSTHALLVDLPLFGGPVVMLGLGLWIVTRRERRRDAVGADQGLVETTGPLGASAS
jgi:cytochrome c-type biogenesis protein CcmH/NrfF